MRAVFFGDAPHRIAGAQKSLLTAVLMARTFGLEPTMVFPNGGVFEELCRSHGLRVRVLEGPPSYEVFGKILLRSSIVSQASVMLREAVPYGQRFARLIDEERADVVHYNTARGAILAGLGAHFAGRNSVMHQRGSVAIGRLYWLFAQSIVDWILLVARALVPEVSPSMRGRASVLYNGINVELPRVDRKMARLTLEKHLGGVWSLGDNVPLFLSLSTPTPFKGLHYVLDAAAIVRSRGLSARYVFAGAPGGAPYVKWLEKKIETLGLQDTVKLVGFVEDTHALLCAADALVLPSVLHERIENGAEVFEDWSNEGLPRSILEAMAAGIPSIASNIAGVSEQIEDGHNGLLVPPKEPVQLADAVERFVRDPNGRERMGEAGRVVVRSRFRIEDAAKGLVDALAMVAAQRTNVFEKAVRFPRLVRDTFLRSA